MSGAAKAVEVLAALAAAGLWLMASLVRVPPFPDVGWDSPSAVFEPIHAALRKASRQNAIAAACAAVAAIASIIA